MIVLKHILVPTDFGEAAEAAIRYGRTLAQTFGAELHLLHVLENGFMRATFADPATIEATARKRLNDRLMADDRQRLHGRTIIEKFDSPSDAIVRYAKSASIDLIVMGTHGRRGSEKFLLGSVTAEVVAKSTHPVITIRG